MVPHNLLKNKFQPLDLTANQSAKAFIKQKFNLWFCEQVTRQLDNGISPHQMSLNLSDLKPLHVKWIVERLQMSLHKTKYDCQWV